MPTNKDFKRLIRARMLKTGEAYTAARAHLLRRSPAAPAAPVAPAAYATLAGMSDASVKRATGCTWEKWVQALDYAHADSWSHRAIADYVRQTYKTPSWWTQTVTVGYERIKGLRAIGQSRGGSYVATRSRTLRAPAAAAHRAFIDGRLRRRWLPEVKLLTPKVAPGRTIRLAPGDGTSVEVRILSKESRSVVQIEHRQLADKPGADARKEFWSARLDALCLMLEAPGRRS